MARKKGPEDITLQRISKTNVDRVLAVEPMKAGDSINDVFTRFLDKYKEDKQKESEKVMNQCMHLFEQYSESKSPYTDGLFKGAFQVAIIVLSEEQIQELLSNISDREKEDEQEKTQ